MVGKIEILNDVKRKLWPGQKEEKVFYFHLKSVNGEIIAQSELYTQKHNVNSLLDDYFPDWPRYDLTIPHD